MGRSPGGLLEQAVELGAGEAGLACQRLGAKHGAGLCPHPCDGASDAPVASVAPGGGADVPAGASINGVASIAPKRLG